MEKKYSLCIVTAPNRDMANEIGKHLVEKKLAACVNIIENVKSIYRWEGKIEESQETMLIIKTKEKLAKDVMQAVKEKHSYLVPEIIFLDISAGNEEYLDFIGANTLFSSNIPDDEERNK